jgi:hypothetical protein
MREFLEALAAFAIAFGLALLFLPLWPLGIRAFIEWQCTPPAPGLGRA